MREQKPNTAMNGLKRLARLGVGLLVASSLAFIVPAIHASAATAPAGGTLVVQDRSHDNDNPDEQLYALYQILNSGTSAVPLSSLSMRYWFVNGTPSDPLQFSCDWAAVNCANITSQFVTLSTPVTGANTYLQLNFTAAAGSIAPGQTTGEIETRIHHQNFSEFDTTASYSFISDPSFVYKNAPNVTLYLNGSLIWGTEPS